MSSEIVVTGLGFVSAWGCTEAAVRHALEADVDGGRVLAPEDSRLADRLDPAPVPAGIRAGWVRDFDPRQAIDAGRLRRMDFAARMLVTACRSALADACLLNRDVVAGDRIGLSIGSMLGNQRETEVFLDRVLDRGAAAGQPFLFPNLVLNAAAGQAAIQFGLTGPCLAVSLEEASGEAALAAGLDLLDAGRCDVVVAGGMDEISRSVLKLLAVRGLVAKDAADKRGPGKSHRGTLLPGEGAACLVLERRDSALQRQVRPRARLVSAATHGIAATPWDFGNPKAIADVFEAGAKTLSRLALIIGGSRAVDPRRMAETLLLERISNACGAPPPLIRPRERYGEFGSCGALDVALACLVVSGRHLPGSAGGTPLRMPRDRVLVTGCGRSGAVVPVLVEGIGGES